MSAIKFLSGPLAGKTFTLKPGQNKIGRGTHCDVVVPTQSLSKEHALIEIYNDKVILSDLTSRNGTFVNGVKIKKQQVQLGEKISFFDVVAVIQRHRTKTHTSATGIHPSMRGSTTSHGALALQTQFEPADPMAQQTHTDPKPKLEANLKSYLIHYIEDVVLPGVYKLLDWFDFRSVLAIFVGLYVFFVTLLSTVPLMRILKSSIEKEAQNRAQTIARALVRDNSSAIMQGQTSLVKTDVADREPGVNKSFVISNYDGVILAPSSWTGQHLTDVPFVHEARKSNQEQVEQIDDQTIVAVAPIRFYKPETGTETTAAHAVVVYNMGSLAVDNGRTISLFVQVLFIAVFLGGLLFFFLYKLILKPIIELNHQTDAALRSSPGTVQMNYRFPELQALATNINSALNRASSAFDSATAPQMAVDRNEEMKNIVQLVGFPAMTINSDRVVTAFNTHFSTHIGTQGDWSQIHLNNILDQSLKLNLQNLAEQLETNPYQLATDQLEISSMNYEITAQAIMGDKKLAYILVVFVPRTGAEV